MGIHVGIYDHLGWAVSITASGDHDVVDRRRIDLIEPGVPNMPIHHPGRGRWRDKIEALVTGAVDHMKRAGALLMFVLGEPGFYQRFGFTTQAAEGFDSPYAGPFFLALELQGGLPCGPRGAAAHAGAFAALAEA